MYWKPFAVAVTVTSYRPGDATVGRVRVFTAPVLKVRVMPSGENTFHEYVVPAGAGESTAAQVRGCPWVGLAGGVTVRLLGGTATPMTTGTEVFTPFWSVAVRVTTTVPAALGVKVYVPPAAVAGVSVPAVVLAAQDRVYVFNVPAAFTVPWRVTETPGIVVWGAPVMVTVGAAGETRTRTGVAIPVRFWSSVTIRLTK